jgi:hypothetical protein
MPSTQATEAFPVSWIGTDESGIRDYDVQVSIHGGPWVDWLVKTTATSATYQGANGYGFAFRVRARDTHGNASPWDVSSVYTSHVTMGPGTFAKVVASSVNIRAAASTSAALVTTAPAGTILAITGGPTNADGFTWWKVSLPIGEWGPVGQVTTDVWVASGDGTNTYVTSIGAPNTTTVGMPGGTVPTPGARFVGIDPLRVLDTRLGTGLWGSFASGAARTFGVAGHGPIPSDAVAVTGTLTVVGQTSAGWASLGPSAATVGSTSVVNAPQGDARGVGVTVMLGPAGTLAAEWSGTGGSRAQMVFDVSGYFEPGTSGATYVPLAPARVLDTRTGNGLAGLFASNLPRSFHVAGHGGVPAGATAVTGNLTAVGPTSGGYLFVGPAATATPTSSNLNVLKGDTRAASVTVKLSAGGDLAAVWKGSPGARTHVLFDVTGYFVAGGGGATYYPLDAVRVLDTRVPNGLAGVFPRNVTRIFQATGRGTIPVDALAVTGSATVVLPTGAGWLNLGPAGTQLGGTSTLNLPRGDTRANGFTVRTGPGGGLAGMYQGVSGAAANVIVDLTGYFR